MMMQEACAEIKRISPSIDTLLEGYEAQPTETASRVEMAEGGYDYRPLLGKLEEYLNQLETRDYAAALTVLETLDTILTPEQINTFLQTTTKLEKHPKYIESTVEFIRKFIRNSYEAGHNNFKLNLENLPALDYIGAGFRVTEANPIIISITGKTGQCCGSATKNCTFNAEETGNECGRDAKHCTFNIQETGDHYGEFAKNCTFITQKTGEWCGAGSSHCTFKTDNEETLAQLIKDIPETRLEEIPYIDQTEDRTHVSKPSGNRIIYIENGVERVVRDYTDTLWEAFKARK